jgi:hypothetical protein
MGMEEFLEPLILEMAAVVELIIVAAAAAPVL